MEKAKRSGLLNITDGAGSVVATLEWFGNTIRGKGKWTNLKDKETSQRISDLMARNLDLREIEYCEMFRDGMTVRGWQGFSGYFQALDDILPAIGLEVDWATVIWPLDFVNEQQQPPAS